MAKKKGPLAGPFVPVEEQPYPIPDNWCWITIGTIAEVKGGKRVPKGNQLIEYRTGHPYIRVTDFDNRSIAAEQVKYIDEETFKLIRKYTISPRDIYISIAGTIGRVGVIPDDLDGANLTENAAKITNIRGVEKNFLLWLLESEVAQAQIRDSTIFTTQPKLALFRIENIKFPLCPLAEQRRIVTSIESLFAKLDEAKEKAQTVVSGFELRKSAILHKAFTGELTERWRKENGVGLDSWKQAVLIDVLKEPPHNGYSPKPVNYVTPYKSMTLSATTSGVFKAEYFKYIDETIPEDSYLWLKPGDILIQRANSLDKVGTSAVYTGREHEFIYPDLMMKLQVVETASPQFVAYSLKRDDSLAYFRANATGTAGNMPKINQKTVSQTPLNLPTYDEQIEIVHILENLFAKEQQAKSAAEAVLSQIDTMKKAILARAFRGELGTNDPAEESAAELLKSTLCSQSEVL